MIRKTNKAEIRRRVHNRIRRKLAGTPERPRLAVFRSEAHIYAQIIDDAAGKTLAAASSVDKEVKTKGGNVAAAKAIGKLVAQRAKEKGVARVVFASRPASMSRCSASSVARSSACTTPAFNR